MNPECDVLLPVYNAEATLGQAVRSILGQSHRRLRLIAIDDGSSDNSLKMLREYRDSRILVLANGRNLGLPATLNRGVGLATAPYIARMDADDIAHPLRLEKQLHLLERRPELDLVGSAVVSIDSEGMLLGQRVYPKDHDDIIKRPYRSIPVAHPTWCGRREWFVKYPYHLGFPRCEDQVLLRNAFKDSCFSNLQEPLLAYRELTMTRPLRTLKVRWLLAKNILLSAIKERRITAGALGSSGLLARWLVDVLVWLTGKPRLATYRFQPLSHAASNEWDLMIQGSRIDTSES